MTGNLVCKSYADFLVAIICIFLNGPQFLKMDADDDLPNGGPPGNNRKKPNLTSEQRREVVRMLLLMVKDATNNLDLKRGSFSTVARQFGVVSTTVKLVWDRARQSLTDGNLGDFQASPLVKGRCGRPLKYDREEVREVIKDVPKHKRTSIRKIGSAVGISSNLGSLILGFSLISVA